MDIYFVECLNLHVYMETISKVLTCIEQHILELSQRASGVPVKRETPINDI